MNTRKNAFSQMNKNLIPNQQFTSPFYHFKIMNIPGTTRKNQQNFNKEIKISAAL